LISEVSHIYHNNYINIIIYQTIPTYFIHFFGHRPRASFIVEAFCYIIVWHVEVPGTLGGIARKRFRSYQILRLNLNMIKRVVDYCTLMGI
jgi:hypothetical protein